MILWQPIANPLTYIQIFSKNDDFLVSLTTCVFKLTCLISKKLISPRVSLCYGDESKACTVLAWRYCSRISLSTDWLPKTQVFWHLGSNGWFKWSRSWACFERARFFIFFSVHLLFTTSHHFKITLDLYIHIFQHTLNCTTKWLASCTETSVLYMG